MNAMLSKPSFRILPIFTVPFRKLFFTLLLGLPFALFAQLNMDFVGNLDYEQNVNDIWGYVSPDGTEYALVGTQSGVSVVSLEDAANPVELFFVEGEETTWRDMKTWGTTGYSVCDNCPDGLLVMDLSDLPNSMPFFFWNDIPDSTFQSAHNIFIDEFGYGYLCGTNLDGGQTIYFDAFTTPGMPSFIDYGPPEYAHDIYVRDNIMYASEISAGQLGVYDVSDKGNTILLGSRETPSNFTHNAWLSDDSNTIFTTDERSFASTTSYDISDFSDIKFLDRFFSEASIGEATIPHNVHVLNDYLVISHYTDGVVVVDAQNPDNLIEVGNYDTYETEGTGFFGCWGAYPFLPSGNILATDRQTGLYVLSPNYVRASYLIGKVTDAVTSAALNNVEIELLVTNRKTTTDAFGNYKTGLAGAGNYEVYFHEKFYEDKTVTIEMTNGETATLDVALDPAVSFTFSGRVTDTSTGAGIPAASLRFENDFYLYEVTTDVDGNYTVADFYPDEYEVVAGHWSHTTTMKDNISLTSGSLDLELEQGYEDDFLLPLGWEVSEDTEQGAWVRERPIGSIFYSNSVPSQYLSPSIDVPEDLGNYALLTGNGEEGVRETSLIGFARITSPPIDMSTWRNPKVSFFHWLTSLRGPFLTSLQDGGGQLDFKMYNGIDTVLVEQWRGDTVDYPSWKMTEYQVHDFITTSKEMRFIFEAQSGNFNNSYDEAAIDFFRAWDESVITAGTHTLNVKTFPNPFRGDFLLEYNFGSLAEAEVRVFDALGKELLYYELNSRRGFLEIGSKLMAGLYFVEVRCGDEKEVLVVLGQ
jgi:choice-of-anchor B domain-containing protein